MCWEPSWKLNRPINSLLLTQVKKKRDIFFGSAFLSERIISAIIKSIINIIPWKSGTLYSAMRQRLKERTKRKKEDDGWIPEKRCKKTAIESNLRETEERERNRETREKRPPLWNFFRGREKERKREYVDLTVTLGPSLSQCVSKYFGFFLFCFWYK